MQCCCHYVPLFPASRDHADIIRYLNGVNIYILQNLGLALGITYSRLQNTQSLSYAADLVDLWLLKIDQVNEKGGPTWATLESVMRDKIVGLNGIADDIRKDKLSGIPHLVHPTLGAVPSHCDPHSKKKGYIYFLNCVTRKFDRKPGFSDTG